MGYQIPDTFNMIALVDRLSNGDITKHDAVYERNVVECYNLLAYWKHRDKQVEYMNRMRK